jgi:archaellum component FlaC
VSEEVFRVELDYIKEALEEIKKAVVPISEKINGLEKQNISVCAAIAEIHKDQNNLGEKVRELERQPEKKKKALMAWVGIGATIFGGSFIFIIYKLFEALSKGVKL